MLLKIVSVDMNGYTGRDFHPTKSDEGLIVSVVDLHTDVVDGEGQWVGKAVRHGKATLDTVQAAFDEIDGKDGGLVYSRCWICVTRDGRTLELMDHEVELHQAGR